MRNGIFHVAKEEDSDEVLGVACWLRPQQAGKPPTWSDWAEDWRLNFNQVAMNLWYGRGGLNVKVCRSISKELYSKDSHISPDRPALFDKLST